MRSSKKQAGKKRHKIIREIIVAGATIFVNNKMSFGGSKGRRGSKSKPTSAAVMRHNDRLAVRNLTMLLNANFYPGDWFATLTYEEAVSPEQARRDIENFVRRMKREYKKLGKEFYYIHVTEYENKRIHHHIVMNYIDAGIINRQWKCGMVRLTGLDRTRNYKDLAEYMIKETQKTFRHPDNATRRRWNGSRNLKRPVMKREIVDARTLNEEEPKPFKGYAIDPDSIHRYEHPFTGMEHVEYMMYSTDPVPRIRTWRKGRIVDRQETYHRAGEIQIDMSMLDGWSFV